MDKNTNDNHYQQLSKRSSIIWKAIYSLAFGWLGYVIMDAMQNNRANTITMANEIIDLQEKVKELDSK